MYVLYLGPENERQEWKNQVEGATELLQETQHPYYPFIQIAAEQALAHLKSSPHPLPSDSAINIKPIDADLSNSGRQDLFPPTIDASMAELIDVTERVRDFTNTTQGWARFIEDAVNAMAKLKGIQQSGKLVLLPPSEIPQL